MNFLAMLLAGMAMSQGISDEGGQDAGGGGAPADSVKKLDLTIHFLGKDQQGGPAPFELANDRVVVKARVAGRDVWAVLDNQSQRSLIDAAFASAVGLKIDPPSGTVLTAFGEIPKRRVSDVPVFIPGQLEMRVPALAAADLKPLSKAVGREISYVIGGDIFGFFALLLDPAKSTFQMEPGGSAKVPATLPSIPLRDGKARLDATVNGKPVVLALDLGSRSALRLSPGAWSRVGPQISGVGAGTVGTGRVTQMAIGPIRGTDVDVEIGPLLTGEADGVVGMGFLKRYLVVLDAKQGKLWLAPRVSSAGR